MGGTAAAEGWEAAGAGPLAKRGFQAAVAAAGLRKVAARWVAAAGC